MRVVRQYLERVAVREQVGKLLRNAVLHSRVRRVNHNLGERQFQCLGHEPAPQLIHADRQIKVLLAVVKGRFHVVPVQLDGFVEILHYTAFSGTITQLSIS